MQTQKPSFAVIEFRLRQVMDEKNLSVPEVSKLTGITTNGLYMMLDRLPRAIRFDTLSRLCVGLGVVPADLFVLRIPKVRT